jgi:hypothetical protein
MAKVNDVAEYPMLIDMANTQAVIRQARSVFSVSAPLHELPCLAQARSLI